MHTSIQPYTPNRFESLRVHQLTVFWIKTHTQDSLLYDLFRGTGWPRDSCNFSVLKKKGRCTFRHHVRALAGFFSGCCLLAYSNHSFNLFIHNEMPIHPSMLGASYIWFAAILLFKYKRALCTRCWNCQFIILKLLNFLHHFFVASFHSYKIPFTS